MASAWKGSADRVDQLLNARDVCHGHEEVTMLRRDSEPIATLQECFLRNRRRGGIVHPDVMHVHAAIVLAVEPADVGLVTYGLEHDRHAVQRLMPRMKNMPGHGAPVQTAAAKWRSKAAVRSAAIAWG